MARFYIFALFVVLSMAELNAFDIVSRDSWGAQPSKSIQYINHVVPFVVIHHTDKPAACYTDLKCERAMRSMQSFHQNDRGWADIGYNFAIGGNGLVYEGRGFNVVGAHAPIYNKNSIGITLIGDWQENVVPEDMLDATKKLIAYAVDAGYLSANYTLLGHRQAKRTTCPGDSLYNEISTWPHFGTDIPVRGVPGKKLLTTNTTNTNIAS